MQIKIRYNPKHDMWVVNYQSEEAESSVASHYFDEFEESKPSFVLYRDGEHVGAVHKSELPNDYMFRFALEEKPPVDDPTVIDLAS